MRSFLALLPLLAVTQAFAPPRREFSRSRPTLFESTVQSVDELKAELLRKCSETPKPPVMELRSIVQKLESASQVDLGLVSGDWELVYAPSDATRSSPFFWAFRQAFPENSDQIFGITDAIPAPLKEIGPAYQTIDYNEVTQTGKFVSRVKVATLGGMATSMMTTRASIVGTKEGQTLELQVDTTKPEDSTVVKTLLGPFGDVLNENAPAFPSGAALEQVRPGSSKVELLTTFVDEGLRISRDGKRPNDIFVWSRREFASFDYL